MLLNTVSVSTTKMKHQSNLYVCWQSYIEFSHECWKSCTILHPFMFLYVHNCLEMWFAFCNTGEHAL